VVLTVVLLTAGGIYSALRMPSGVYPEVTFSRIGVVAKVPSLTVANMDVQVTQPLEQAVSTVSGVNRVRSKTIRGASELDIDFAPGTDMQRALTLTWNRIGAARSQLPPETELTVEQMTPSIFPIISLVLTGGNNASDLRDYAFYRLAPQIKSNVPDVLYANVAGGDLREIEVEARPQDLLQHGLSAADLADRIGKAYRLMPVGRVEHPPFAFQMIVNTQSQDPRKLEELVVASKNNQPVLLRDVADLKIGHADRTQSIGFAGKDAVVVTIYRRLGGNTVTISSNLEALLKKINMPKGISATIVYDQAGFVNTAIQNVRDAIIIGGLFSVLILLAFLRSWRATLISALAIPTTLAITFLFLHWSGATLNLMSLGGLAVAIGLIIDDTVVVIENIARHLSPATPGAQATPSTQYSVLSTQVARPNGPDNAPQPPHAVANSQASPHAPTPAAHVPTPSAHAPAADPVDAASGEITGAVVGSTLTTVLVFVPLAFIVGVYGQFFASLSWALSIAVLVSMVISLTLIPVFAAKFLAGKPMPPPGRIYHFFEHIYDSMLAEALRWPWVMLGLSVAAVGVGFVLYTGIPDFRKKQEAGKPPPAPWVKGIETGLMPAMDEGAFVFDYWGPSGTPLEQMEKMLQSVEEVISNHPDIKSYVRRTGSENGLFATQTSRGDITIVLREDEDPLTRLYGGKLPKPVRPTFKDMEKDNPAFAKLLKEKEKELGKEGLKQWLRGKYRRRPLKDVMDEIEDQAKDMFAEHQLKIETAQIMADELSDLSGASKPIEIKLFGPDHNTLRDLADKVGEILETKGKGRGFKEVNSNVLQGNPDLLIQVDGEQAARRGLTADMVERQLHAIFLGQIATQVRESALRITDVRVRYPDKERFGVSGFDPQRLLNQWLLLPDLPAPAPGTIAATAPPDRDRFVLLSSVARVKAVRTPDEQHRENQQPAAFVTSQLDETEAGLNSAVADVRNWMSNFQLPAGYRWDLGGHYLQQQQAFQSLLLVMIVAILLVFIMLAFQFKSVVLPLLIFMTQPLSLVSGLFALWITNTPLNVSSYMGAILLIGLDMKNGILLVEYIQQLRHEGMALRPALMLAGRTRFRPILMTSLAAILGLFPLALGMGPGAQMQQPLAIMVIGGLTANMLFTRLVIPVGYLVLERKSETDVSAPAAVSPPDARTVRPLATGERV
jgi:multidrug efflux pump subunit AcrB